VIAFALCWPNDPRPLLYLDRERAEEDLKWFAKNYTRDSQGQSRGVPFIVELAPREYQ
jgi:hypothetical protein